MADEPEDGAKRFKPVDPRDLIAFLDAKKANGSCSYCQTSTWSLMSEIQNERSNLIALTNDAPSLSNIKFTSVLTLFCDNCGNVRMISKQKFDEWTANKSASDG